MTVAVSTPSDLWLCYQRSMDRYRHIEDTHTRNLMLADAQACLDLWFKATEKQLQEQDLIRQATRLPEIILPICVSR